MNRHPSIGRRSSTNPVRVSIFERDDKNSVRVDSRRTLTTKPKTSTSTAEGSQIPRIRFRSSSADPTNRKSNLIATGKTPLRVASSTPRTPSNNNGGYSLGMGSAKSYTDLSSRSPMANLSYCSAVSIRSKVPRKEKRPLGDKTYQNQMLNKIDSYISSINQATLLNNNCSLKPITLNMFVEVSNHLLKILGFKPTLTKENYIEELPKIAKKMTYPGIISKSWLRTANAMHSWPNVLGWLAWLVELCQVKEIATMKFNLENMSFTGTDEHQIKMNRLTFFSILRFYNAWNDEKLDEEAALVNQFLEEINEAQGVTEEDLIQIQKQSIEEENKLKSIDARLAELTKQEDEIRKKLQYVIDDETKLLSEIKTTEESIKKIILENEQKRPKCKTLKDSIELLKFERNEIITALKNQSMSANERDEIQKQCVQTKNDIKEFDSHLKDIEKELYALDIKSAKGENKLTKMSLNYNKKLFMQLSAFNINYEDYRMPEQGLGNKDVEKMLNTKLNLINEMKKQFIKELNDYSSASQVFDKEKKNLADKLKHLQIKRDDLIEESEKKKSIANSHKIQSEKQEDELLIQIKNIQVEIEKMKNAVPSTETIIADLEEAKKKYKSLKNHKDELEKKAELFFTQFYKILNKHRIELQKHLE